MKQKKGDKRNKIVNKLDNKKQLKTKVKKQQINVNGLKKVENGIVKTIVKPIQNKHESHSLGDSIQEGKDMLQWILSPTNVDDFMKKYWEKKPLLLKRKDAAYYQSLLTTEGVDNMLKNNHLEFTKNIDITSYEDDVRKTLNPEGRAIAPVVWNYYQTGCSIRILNPQTFQQSIYKMNAKLQEYFHCMVGTNVYLTPPESQGFAPHYDDIEAFVLQLEGKKLWRVYEPRNINESLPRVSSDNFKQDEIGEPILEVTLEAGDLLYFPRGFIHQAVTVKGEHSLHITMSAYQKTSYADLLEILIPASLQCAIADDLDMRKGLPIDIYQIMGSVHSADDDISGSRQQIRNKIKGFFDKLFSYSMIDEAVDQMAKKYQTDALPPYLSKNEKQQSIEGTKFSFENGEVELDSVIDLESNVKLVKANALRLVDEEDMNMRVYFHTDNSKEYHEYEPSFLDIDIEDTPIIVMLVKEYPKYVKVSDLPIDDDERKVLIVKDLWERGLLLCNNDM